MILRNQHQRLIACVRANNPRTPVVARAPLPRSPAWTWAPGRLGTHTHGVTYASEKIQRGKADNDRGGRVGQPERPEFYKAV